MSRRELLEKAIERFGREAQMVKCCEECGELVQAVCKWIGGTGDEEAVIEEMVDVEIMLEQVRMILGVDPDVEAQWRALKLMRLKDRLG